jgi:N-acetylglucosaminyldiphosphoundecaprenol N-acetyl-beta-D-mannosaminyltransferase
MQAGPFPSFSLLNASVHPLTKVELLGAIESAMDSRVRNGIIGNHNLHSLYLVQRNHHMQEFYQEALITHVDGMSLVLLGRIFGHPISRSHRTGYLDWIHDFLAMAEARKWRIYFLGGKPEVAPKVTAWLQQSFPALQLRCHHGYDAFTPETRVYEEIAAFEPDIVLVGMGMPLQEKWILEARQRIETGLFFQCGAIMEYLVGEQRPAPRWMGQLGIEWLYRLVTRPRALAYRYIVEPLKLSPAIVRELAKRRMTLESE